MKHLRASLLLLFMFSLPYLAASQQLRAPGGVLEEAFFGANFFLNGDAELGPVDIPSIGYRPPYEFGIPRVAADAGEIRIVRWNSSVSGEMLIPPATDETDFGAQLFTGTEGRSSRLNRSVLVRDFGDAFAEGSITLHVSGWFGGIGSLDDSARVEIDIIDAGRRLLVRETIGNITRTDRNGETVLHFDALHIVMPEQAYAVETRFIMANGGLADNLRLVFLSDQHDNSYTLPADLHVPQIAVAEGGFSGTTIDIEWTVQNRGETATNQNWVDRVVLSTEPSAFAGTRYTLGEFANISALEPGQTYTTLESVTLPELLQGPYFIMVYTDARSRQTEYTTENNVSDPQIIELTTSPYPDLQVSSLVAPPTAFSGDSIDVSWTVTNFGTGPAVPSRWTDAIYMGENEELDFVFFGLGGDLIRVRDTFVTSFEHVGALRPGESYTVTRRIRLPDHLTGEQHLFVFTDKPDGAITPRYGDVFEFLFPLNNWKSVPISIILTPPPDLTAASAELEGFPASVTDPFAPRNPEGNGAAVLASGEEYTLTWTTENQGPGGTRVRFWQDAVFLSEQPVYDSTAVRLLRTASIDQRTPLLPDTDYTATTRIRIPDGLEGTHYLHVYTNFTRQVYEHTFTDNNVRTLGPVEILRSTYPDLAVTSLNIPTEGTAGERLRVDWEVTNVGKATASGSRNDDLYLSASTVFNREEAIKLGTFPTDTSLEEGETQRLTQAVRIPSGVAPGVYHLFVKTNAGNDIFEWPTSDNNIAGSQPVTIAAYSGAMLTVSDIVVPGDAVAGTVIEAGWTIRNEGAGSMLNRPWTEQVWLIPADTSSASSVLLLDTQQAVPLQTGEERERIRTLSLPDGLDQPHFLGVTLRYPVPDSDQPEEVSARSATAIDMDPGPRRDLVIVQTDAPDSIAAGEVRHITWTVTNQGVDGTGEVAWFDTIYLLDDPDKASSARPLARWDHTGGLSAGDSYTATVEVEVPAQVDGDYFWVIKTDTRNRVFEYQAEENNIFILPVSTGALPTTDLIVTDIHIPAQTVAGEPFTVTWEIENIGANPARGRLRDGVYLIPTDAPDQRLGNAFLLGVAERDIDLPPGERMRLQHRVDASCTLDQQGDGALTVPMPGVDPGLYRVGVQTNIRASIPESDRTNNTLFTTEALEVSIPQLAAGDQVMSAFVPGDVRYFSFDAPEGQDLLFTARTDDGVVANLNLYVRYEETPTRVRHDRSATLPFANPQQLIIPDSRAGTYVAMVQLESSDSDSTQVHFDVQVRGFEVREIVPALGGNVGPVTVRIHGSRFTDSTVVYLEDRNGGRLDAFETVLRSRAEILARFHLEGADTGDYDVVAVTPDGNETRLSNGFEIITGSGADVQTLVHSPNYIRSQEEYEFTVDIINNGDTNALDYFVMVELFGINAVGNEGEYLPVRFTRIDENFPELVYEMPRNYQRWGHVMQVDDFSIIPFWFYEIPPGARVRFRVKVNHNGLGPIGGSGGAVIQHYTKIIPMPESDFTRSGAVADMESAVGFRIMNAMYEKLVDDLFEEAAQRAMLRDAGYNGLVELVTTFAQGGMPTLTGITGTAAGGAAGYLLVAALYTNPATGLLATGFALGTLVTGTLITMKSTRDTRDDLVEQGSTLIRTQLDPISADRNRYINSFSTTEVVDSEDPNDIIGPEGFGDERWVGITQPLDYRIRYENDPDLASAPAQVVRIVHPLDESTDIRAFRLGSFGFADTTFSVPDNVATYSTRLDMRASMGLFVDMVAGLDVQRREAFWLFRSIDPATGDLVTDAMTGYLAVNDSTGAGEGFVTYSIRANPQAVTGDTIHAEASIFFDNNAPIDTPPIFNTIDADMPESEILVDLDDDVFEITWTGRDVGAGIARSDLYVSVDDGPFTRVFGMESGEAYFINRSSPTATYRFFTLGFDHAGNREPMKSADDALVVTSTDQVSSDLPKEFAIRPVFPNPFNPTTTLPFELPSAGDVRIVVFDILGRSVLSMQLGTVPAGRHTQPLHMQRFATGVYFAEIQVIAEGGQRWRAVQPMTLIK